MLLCLFAPTAHAGEVGFDPWEFIGLVDPTCYLMTYKCVPLGCGCSKTPPMCYDSVCHAYPAAFIETPVKPWDSEISFISFMMGAIRYLMPDMVIGGGGGSAQEGQNNLKYTEAHVFNFPTWWYFEMMFPLHRTCPYRGAVWELNYMSELDAINWRTGASDYITKQFIFSMLAQITQVCELKALSDSFTTTLPTVPTLPTIPGLGDMDVCMGTWGPTYPRTGFAIANSKAVGSAMNAYRALRVVSSPMLRVVLGPRDLGANGFLQIGSPGGAFRGKPINCIPVGATPLVWDNADIRPIPAENKGYVWVWWETACCCWPTTLCYGVF